MDIYTCFIITTRPQTIVLIHQGSMHSTGVQAILDAAFDNIVSKVTSTDHFVTTLASSWIGKQHPEEWDRMVKDPSADPEFTAFVQETTARTIQNLPLSCMPIFYDGAFATQLIKILTENIDRPPEESVSSAFNNEGRVANNQSLSCPQTKETYPSHESCNTCIVT